MKAFAYRSLYVAKKSYVVEESNEELADAGVKINIEEEEEEDEIVKSDIELEGDMVEPDNEPLQKMGDPSAEVTDDNLDASHSAKAKAMDAISEASVYIKMKKPNAAIRDANAALEIRKDVKGSLFVVKRNTQPRFQFIVMNRRNTDNLVENLLGDFEYEVQDKYLLYHNASQEKKWYLVLRCT